ncbi:unnamed protein product [Larinioides sclopetarius]|uniref:Uncharacterized protein n=1 Tax=Larinioides sclopetarius TaxID=280406 RepID=A0AAV1YW50_9ARAC
MMRLFIAILFLSVMVFSFLICEIRTQNVEDVGYAIEGSGNNFAQAARDDGLLCDDEDDFGC